MDHFSVHVTSTTTPPPRPKSWGAQSRASVVRVLKVVVAMSGWRFERLSLFWIAGGLASFALAGFVVRQNVPLLTTVYFAATALAYYLGNAILLGARARSVAIARFGEEEAWRRYERTVGLMFMNQGLGLGAMTSIVEPSTALAHPTVIMIGALLFALGFATKLWATLVVGLDTYYFKDMFLGRPIGAFVVSGPYRFFAHPMYTVGHLHAYGYAILQGSYLGIGAAAICHLGLLVFYWTAERPFIRRVYGV